MGWSEDVHDRRLSAAHRTAQREARGLASARTGNCGLSSLALLAGESLQLCPAQSANGMKGLVRVGAKAERGNWGCILEI